MKLNILGKSVPVKVVKESEMENDQCWGEYIAEKNVINISDKHYSDDSLEYTVFHEALHATLERIGLELGEQTEEILVTSIENMVKLNWKLEPKNADIVELFANKDHS